MATEYGQRLRAARKHAGLTQEEAGKRTGIAQSTISTAERVGNGSADTPVYAKAYGVDSHWLATGEGEMLNLPAIPPMPQASNVADAPALASSRVVPVVGHVKGGSDGYLEEMQFPPGYGEGFVEFWTKDSSAYALRVKGDSMHPRYRAGEFIVVTPSIEAQPGRDVVVKLRDGRKLLKLLNWVRGDEVQLLSINDGYAPTTLSADEIESIHRVAGGVPQDAFQEARPH